MPLAWGHLDKSIVIWQGLGCDVELKMSWALSAVGVPAAILPGEELNIFIGRVFRLAYLLGYYFSLVQGGREHIPLVAIRWQFGNSYSFIRSAY
jgi:hypothetical protein